MKRYTTIQILKTLDKLFESGYTTTNKIRTIKWENLDQINKKFTPVEKSLVMDFRDAVAKRKIIEFLAGIDVDKESEKKQ